MPIRVICEKCKKTLSVKDHLAGKKIKCPVCQNVVLVSGTAPRKDEPPSNPTPAPGPPAGKQPEVATKPAKTAKPSADKVKTNGAASNDKSASTGAPAAKKPTTNGTPTADKAKPNGSPAKPPEPSSVERPPEHVEAEALEAFTDASKPAEDETPKTIDFTCMYCEQELHLPLEEAGKQMQCPNVECKRILKVPLPKVVEKRDWRKMDRQGPASARINQPEQLEKAWGTEETTQARQASLAQAGVLDEPRKPLGVFGWLRRGFYGVFFGIVLVGAGVGATRLFATKQQTNAIKETLSLVDPRAPKIRKQLLQAEARRALGLLCIRSTERKVPASAREFFIGARASANVKLTKEDHGINEQMFLADLAVTHIEFADTIDQFNNKEVWDKIRDDIKGTLSAIPSGEIQAMAMRAVASRLIEKNQIDNAISLVESLSQIDLNTTKRPPVNAQRIALLYIKGDKETVKDRPDLTKIKVLTDTHIRVGFAEGHARKEQYDEAFKLATFEGPAKDRLEACLGVAALALDRKNNAEAVKCLDHARAIIQDKNAGQLSPWHILELIRLNARADDADHKTLLESLDKQFTLQAHVELLQAKCAKSPSRLTPECLREIELLDDKDGTTLAIAWLILARHNARCGDSRAQNRHMFEQHMKIVNPEVGVELLRPMVDIGTYVGSMK